MEKLTETQRRTLSKLAREYHDANEMDFETWCWKSYYCGDGHSHTSFEDYMKSLRWFAKRDQPRDVEGYIAKELARLRKTYEEHSSGIVPSFFVSSNTLRALERKGFIEIIYDSANSIYGVDTVKLLTVCL